MYPGDAYRGAQILGAGEKVIGGLDIDTVYEWRAQAWENALASLGQK